MLTKTSIQHISNNNVRDYIAARSHKSYLFAGDNERVMAKVKMWLFYKANKYLLHDDISYLSEEIITRIIEGYKLEDAFFMKIG